MNLTRLHLQPNPIIVKELRSRMRDWRAFATLTGMLLVLGGGSYLLYRLIIATSGYSVSPLSPQIGQMLFISLAVLELMTIAAVAPAVTAGAISGEQEKLTYEMLLATPLRPGAILWGKLVSALSYVFLLIFAAVPMASLIFIFGGVTLRDMVKALIILFTVAVMLGMVGLFMSAWLGRTARATVISYLIVAALLGAPVVAYVAVGILTRAEPPRWILVPNPLSALLSAISTTMRTDMPFGQIFWYLGSGLTGDMRMLTGSTVSLTGIPRPVYHYSLPLYGLITLVLYLLSTRLVRPARRWTITRRELALGGGAILLFVGLVVAVFLATTGRYEERAIVVSPKPEPPLMAGPAVVVEQAVQVAVPQDVGVGGPTPTPLPVDPNAAGQASLAEEDQAAVYAAVIARLYQEQAGSAPVIYLINQTDDMTGDPALVVFEPQVLSEGLQNQTRALLALENSLQNVEVVWVGSDQEAADKAQEGSDLEGPVILKLGNIHFNENGSPVVPGSIFLGSERAYGATFVVELVDGAWQVAGKTGFEWNR